MSTVIRTILVKESDNGIRTVNGNVIRNGSTSTIGVKGDSGPIGPQGPTGPQGPMREIRIETITLTAQHIFNKKFPLSNVPQEPLKLELTPIGGVPQVYGIDYAYENGNVSWDGLGLDGFLELNEQVIVRY